MADDGSQSGGLLGIDPNLLINLGMGLMAGSRFGSNAGEGMLQGMQSYQQQRAGNQNYQINAYNLQRQKAMNQMLQGLMQQPQDASQQSSVAAPQQPDQTGGTGTAPPQQAPAQSPTSSLLTPPNMSGMSVGGMNPRAAQMYSILNGKDPLQAASEVRTQQQAMAQLQVAPALAKLDTAIKSGNTSQYMAADPELRDAWASLAPHAGYDPMKDATDDQKVRMALTMGRNQLAAAVGKESLAPNVQDQQIDGPLGAKYSKNPLSGEIKQEIAPQETDKFIQPDGSIKLMTKADGMRQGLTPFQPAVYGAQSMTDQAKDLAYQQWKNNGGVMPPGLSRNPVMGAQMLDYFAQRAKAEGLTGLSVIATGQQTKAAAGVVKDFTSGKSAQSLNGLNTAVAHMDALDPLIDNLNNTQSPAFNKVANFFKTQTGSTAPTNYAAIKEFVGGEVAKAVLPGGGGEAERQALTAPLNAANSPEMLKQAVQQIKTALAGKTEALRNQWEVGTNGTQGDFDKFLLPPTKKALGIGAPAADAPAAPAMQNAQGWVLHKDAQGNMAYVSPDGKQFQEVKRQ